MKTELLELLRCPTTGQRLTLEADGNNSKLIDAGWMVSEDGQHRYPIRNSIPRFVPQANYADNFGMQWNYFRETQLDSHSGLSISADRFWLATGWLPADLKDQWVLDAGCGAGRFAEEAHKMVGRVAAKLKLDMLVLVGEQTTFLSAAAIAEGFDRNHVFYFDQTAKAAEAIAFIAQEGDVILAKGSRAMELERVVKALQPEWTGGKPA